MDMDGNPIVDFEPAPGHSVSGFGDWVSGTNSYEGGVPIPISKNVFKVSKELNKSPLRGFLLGRISVFYNHFSPAELPASPVRGEMIVENGNISF